MGKEEHIHHYELHVDREREWGFETLHILATCECGDELTNIDIEDRINIIDTEVKTD